MSITSQIVGIIRGTHRAAPNALARKPVYITSRVDQTTPRGTRAAGCDGGLRFDFDPRQPGWQEDSLWVGGYSGPRKSIHTDRLPDFLRDFEPGALFVHNIEPIPDVRWDEPAEVKQTVVEWSNQIRYMREARPDMLFSMYGVPQREYWSAAHGRADELAAWRAANDVWQPFIDTLNVITPSLYTFYDFSHVSNAGNNRRYIAANIAESRRVAKGKPVLPFVWADYHDSNANRKGTPIDLEQWREEVRLILSQADGVILWNYRPTAHAEHLKVLLEEAAIK